MRRGGLLSILLLLPACRPACGPRTQLTEPAIAVARPQAAPRGASLEGLAEDPVGGLSSEALLAEVLRRVRSMPAGVVEPPIEGFPPRETAIRDTRALAPWGVGIETMGGERGDLLGEAQRARRIPAAVLDRALRIRTERIYGDDDRLDIGPGAVLQPGGGAAPPEPPGALPDWRSRVLANSRGVALVLEASELQRAPEGTWRVASSTYGKKVQAAWNLPLCPQASARFAGQPVAGFCTAWLVGADRVMTAGHCLPAAPEGGTRPDLRVLFGWRVSDSGTEPGPHTAFPAGAVYEVRNVLARRTVQGSLDHMILVLDRPVETSLIGPPLAVRAGRGIEAREPLYLLGHPRGLPLKLASNGRSTRDIALEPAILTNLDAFHGNSGSPVFSGRTHEVVGMLVGGRSDLAPSLDGSCVREIRSGVATGGEAVLRATRFPDPYPP